MYHNMHQPPLVPWPPVAPKPLPATAAPEPLLATDAGVPSDHQLD